jgi:DNA-binding GntR family transcriptional regulator
MRHGAASSLRGATVQGQRIARPESIVFENNSFSDKNADRIIFMAFPETTAARPRTASDSAETLTLQAYGRLRADILGGRLEAGERLRLERLKSAYGFGMSPLREALSRLAAEELVIAEDRRGFRVASISAEELAEVTRLRKRLETMALADSIAAGDVDWEAGIVAAFHRLSKAPLPLGTDRPGVADDWEAMHRDFHHALIAACASPWLLKFCGQLAAHAERYRRIRHYHSVGPEQMARDVDREHRELLEATLARDSARACAILEQHFDRTARVVAAVIG